MGLMGEFTVWCVSGSRQRTSVWAMEGQRSFAELQSRTPACGTFSVLGAKRITLKA